MYEMLLYICAFASGVVVMALEMLVGRTLTPYFGGTVYTWGALISVFLAGMASGYAAAGHLADRRPSLGAVVIAFGLAGAAILVPPFGADTIMNGVLDRISDVRYGALAAALALAFTPAALLAAISPYCMRLLLREAHLSGTTSGRLSASSTLGSIVGALTTTFFLIPNVGVKTIYMALATLSAAFAVLTLAVHLARSRKGPASNAVAAAMMMGLAALTCGAPGGAARASTPAQPGRPDGVIETVDSEYNTIIIEKYQSLVAMEFGYRNLKYIESVKDLSQPDRLVVPYTQYMTLGLAYPVQPVHRIVLIGLGGGHTVSYLLKSDPALSVDVAELDPSVIKLSQKYFGVQSGPRLKIFNQDGRVFIQQNHGKYDVAMLDAYRGPFVPFHLTTKEFYQLVKSRLAPGGVVVQNVDPSTLLFDSTYLTMKSVFANVDVDKADENVVLIGYDGPPLSAQALAARAAARQAERKFPYDLRAMAKTRSPAPAVKGKVLTDDFAPVEMLNTIKRHNVKQQ